MTTSQTARPLLEDLVRTIQREVIKVDCKQCGYGVAVLRMDPEHMTVLRDDGWAFPDSEEPDDTGTLTGLCPMDSISNARE